MDVPQIIIREMARAAGVRRASDRPEVNRALIRQSIAVGGPNVRNRPYLGWSRRGSWKASGNRNQGTTTSVPAPGSLDLAQFVAFSGTVTGAVGSQILDIGPGGRLTLGGGGVFGNVTVGQDLGFYTGAAAGDSLANPGECRGLRARGA